MSMPAGKEGEKRRNRHSSRRDHDKNNQYRRRGGENLDLVPLAALISREMKMEKLERPKIRSGYAAQSRKGEDYFLLKEDCQRVTGSTSSTFAAFAVSCFPSKLKEKCLSCKSFWIKLPCIIVLVFNFIVVDSIA